VAGVCNWVTVVGPSVSAGVCNWVTVVGPSVSAGVCNWVTVVGPSVSRTSVLAVHVRSSAGFPQHQPCEGG